MTTLKPIAISRTFLKDQSRPALVIVLAVNLAAQIAIVKTGRLAAPDFNQLAQQWHDFLPAGAGVALASVINGLLSPSIKASLVFWRWKNPLPGSFAFSYYAERDPRIDVAALRRIVNPWPIEPRDQNVQWYKLYKSVEAEPAVIDAHRHFLFTRDYSAIAFFMLFAAGPLSIWYIASRATAGVYLGILALQYLLVRQAACNYGVRLVTTVLALHTSK